MRGLNLFADMGFLRPLRRIKVKSPTLRILKPLLFGAWKQVKN
jgi:hypothetical protein